MSIDKQPDVITITEEDVDYFDKHGTFPPEPEKVVTSTQPSETIDITFKDIVNAEAHDPNRRTDRVILQAGSQEQYDAGVVESLSQDITELRRIGKGGKEIFKEVVSRYHPDLYLDQDQPTQQRAGEYVKVMFAMRKMGVFNG